MDIMLLSLIHNIILATILILLAIYLVLFSSKYRKENQYGFNSTILVAVILVIIAISIVTVEGLFPYPLNAVINLWIGIIFGIQGAYFIIVRSKYDERGNKENINEATYEEGEITLQSEYLRKAFHIVVLLVVFCYFFIALAVNDFVYKAIYLADPQLYESIWSTSQYPLHPKTTEDIQIVMIWTLWFFIAAFLLLVIPDIFRIYNRRYSMFSVIYKRVIRMKEFYACGPQIYLTLGCTVVFLFVVLGYLSPMVAIAAMLIAALGDAAAALIGRRYGTHKFSTTFQKDEKKSYEGLAAGFGVSWLVSFIFVGPLIALIGAFTFSIIDYLNPKIADNVLNPICCTLTMMIPFWLAF